MVEMPRLDFWWILKHSATQAAAMACSSLLQTAMEMYGLEKHEVIHEELLETRVGHSASTCLGFPSSATFNFQWPVEAILSIKITAKPRRRENWQTK